MDSGARRRLATRVLRVLQQRICFTEPSPHELPEHADKFGAFGLEFDADVVRGLGAAPVLYVPEPNAKVVDGSDADAALVAVALDAKAVIDRMAGLHEIPNGEIPLAEQIQLNTSFTGNLDLKQNITRDTGEVRNLRAALGHGLTPLGALTGGLGALLNFFYPADDRVRDKLLEYYRQRDWRIACAFTVLGQEVVRQLTTADREKILQIDAEFFTRTIDGDFGPVERLIHSVVVPGINGKPVIEMVHRVIVPASAIDRAKAILADPDNAPPVIALEGLT